MGTYGFGNMKFTTLGLNLLAKAQAGAALNFTRIAIGDGYLNGQDATAFTALIEQKKSLNISDIIVSGSGSAMIAAMLSNTGMVSGFYWREIGVFATDPQLGEILYGYDNCTGYETYIPPESTSVFEATINVSVYISNAESVTATIDHSLIFATMQQVTDAIAGATTNMLSKTGDGSDVTAAFTQADARENISTGEKLSVLMGKIKKYFADFGTAAFKNVGTGASDVAAGDAPAAAQVAAISAAAADATTKASAAQAAAISAAATDATTKANAAEAAAISAAATDATTKANNAQTAAIAASKDKTAISGVLKGDGTNVSAAVRGTDFSLALSGTGTIAASASWSGPDAQGYYTYAVTATGVLVTDNVDITCVKSVSDSAAAALIQTAWNLMDNVVIAADTLTFYAKTRPSVAIPIAWRVVR